MTVLRVLALSYSRAGDGAYLQAFLPMINDFFGDTVKNITFVPYAGVSVTYDDYVKKVREATKSLPYQWTALHQGGC